MLKYCYKKCADLFCEGEGVEEEESDEETDEEERHEASSPQSCGLYLNL